MFAALRWATIAVAKHEDMRIVHFSIQGTHLHLIVEAASRTALSHGMKAFLVSAAKRANHAKDWKVDPFTNGWQFAGWKEREGEWLAYQVPPTYESLITWFPKTWLLTEGWRKHGLISIHERPGPEQN